MENWRASVTNDRRTPLERLAGAPISWGICEVPGWGLMMDIDRVLDEMLEVGMNATELGASGFFPDDPTEVKDLLSQRSMTLIGGFVPLVLHHSDQRGEAMADALRWAQRFEKAGAQYFVTAPIVDADWSPRYEMPADEMRHLCAMLGELDAMCADHGLTQVLHPHANTTVEQWDDVRRVLDGSEVKWCLDTGHLAIGGTDPVAFARDYASRVGHVHLKDVDTAIAERFNAGEFTLMQAVQHGLFKPLGQGDVGVADVVNLLEGDGYQGWYVIEQDQAISEVPELGSGPIGDVRVSVAFLRTLSDGI